MGKKKKRPKNDEYLLQEVKKIQTDMQLMEKSVDKSSTSMSDLTQKLNLIIDNYEATKNKEEEKERTEHFLKLIGNRGEYFAVLMAYFTMFTLMITVPRQIFQYIPTSSLMTLFIGIYGVLFLISFIILGYSFQAVMKTHHLVDTDGILSSNQAYINFKKQILPEIISTFIGAISVSFYTLYFRELLSVSRYSTSDYGIFIVTITSDVPEWVLTALIMMAILIPIIWFFIARKKFKEVKHKFMTLFPMFEGYPILPQYFHKIGFEDYNSKKTENGGTQPLRNIGRTPRP